MEWEDGRVEYDVRGIVVGIWWGEWGEGGGVTVRGWGYCMSTGVEDKTIV